ncbi:MAG TPA: hypothetical protein VH877_32000 [Polyangia bacterium]|jgi:hypothetical protein|nr:hypothetical protein [Polyangia bacterium]
MAHPQGSSRENGEAGGGPSRDARDAKRRAWAELDGLVVSTELTVISIIQGVALYFLTSATIDVVTRRQWAYLPHVVSGLFVIFLIWSRSLVHIFTVIGWPLSLGHNYLYILGTLVESLLFSQVASPLAWWTLSALYAAVMLYLAVFDLRLIRDLGPGGRHRREGQDSESAQLRSLLEAEQCLQAHYVLPLVLLASVAVAALHWREPAGLAEARGTLWLGLLQMVGFGLYVVYTVRWCWRLAPRVVAARAERLM